MIECTTAVLHCDKGTLWSSYGSVIRRLAADPMMKHDGLPRAQRYSSIAQDSRGQVSFTTLLSYTIIDRSSKERLLVVHRYSTTVRA